MIWAGIVSFDSRLLLSGPFALSALLDNSNYSNINIYYMAEINAAR